MWRCPASAVMARTSCTETCGSRIVRTRDARCGRTGCVGANAGASRPVVRAYLVSWARSCLRLGRFLSFLPRHFWPVTSSCPGIVWPIMVRSLSSFLFLLAGLPVFTAAGRSNYNTPTLCQVVDAKLPGRVSYPGSAAYNASQSAYYTGLEREIRPRCVFRPQDASEVQQLIRLVKSSQGNFAIRGGGHILWGGAANIENGLTLDLRSLNSFALSQDKKTVTVGGGTIWSDLYPKLTPYGLAVSGARVPGIAVGGYVLGCKNNAKLIMIENTFN